MTEDNSRTKLTAYIVGSYLDANKLAAQEIPDLIGTVYRALGALGADPASGEPPVEKLTSARIRKSITADALVSFEDGKPYKQLKRHLTTRGLTPDQYRAKWGLPKDYPMVAPAYSAKRSELAKATGLGARVGKKAEPIPAPVAKVRPKGRLGLFKKSDA